ncbi:MAG: helix-turn-helix domain-containing protein [Bacteroidales bacterium]|nr:helix-turn-helix domain-containing protein [Bacteroidales bacterium]
MRNEEESKKKQEGDNKAFQDLMDKIKLEYDKQCLANQTKNININIFCIIKQLIEALDGVKKETTLVKQCILELNGQTLNDKGKNILRLSPVRLYTTKEVCQILGICERKLYSLRKNGYIHFVREGHFVRFSAQHINDFVKEMECNMNA